MKEMSEENKPTSFKAKDIADAQRAYSNNMNEDEKALAAAKTLIRLAPAREDLIKGVVFGLGFLTNAERVKLFSQYCAHCGQKDPSCPCWNDE